MVDSLIYLIELNILESISNNSRTFSRYNFNQFSDFNSREKKLNNLLEKDFDHELVSTSGTVEIKSFNDKIKWRYKGDKDWKDIFLTGKIMN